MTITVDKGVGLPVVTRNAETRELTEVLEAMDEGDSFFWDLRGRKESSQRLRIHARARVAKVTVIIHPEGEGLRVWKVPVKGKR